MVASVSSVKVDPTLQSYSGWNRDAIIDTSSKIGSLKYIMQYNDIVDRQLTVHGCTLFEQVVHD